MIRILFVIGMVVPMVVGCATAEPSQGDDQQVVPSEGQTDKAQRNETVSSPGGDIEQPNAIGDGCYGYLKCPGPEMCCVIGTCNNCQQWL